MSGRNYTLGRRRFKVDMALCEKKDLQALLSRVYTIAALAFSPCLEGEEDFWLDRMMDYAHKTELLAVHIADSAKVIRCGDSVRGVLRGRHTRRREEFISTKLRFTILQRDGFACQYCGRKPPNVELAVDHVHSVRDGGKSSEDNLLTSCWDCNFGKGARSLPPSEISSRSPFD